MIKNEGGMALDLPSVPDDLLPTVTVVTPTYNRQELFDIAIRNYKNFSYPRHKLFWLILDDSPTDSLKTLIDEHFASDKSVCYMHHDTKEPIGRKRNRMAQECKTQVICHMDDDDYYYQDSVKIRVLSMIAKKKPVSGCLQYNCYNIVDDTQFIARGKEELLNVGEASLCYLKDYWNQYKFNDNDTHEEAVYFLQQNPNNFVNIPCLWVLLSITHNNNVSSRVAVSPVLDHSFLELLPAVDSEYIKALKLKLMKNDPDNKKALELIEKMKSSNTPERIIDGISAKLRKNIFIIEYLNTLPSKSVYNPNDFLIICFNGQYVRDLDFEKETELINFIQKHKNKYRFTIFTNCEKGYSFNGITVSPHWKWRTCNKYYHALVYADCSHFKNNFECKKAFFYNKHKFDEEHVQSLTDKEIQMVTDLTDLANVINNS